MALQQSLKQSAKLVDQRLEDVLAPQWGNSAPAERAPERLVAAMRHAALAGGKRFRPLLVMESARLFGARPETALDAAIALELVHCYSLAHDDLPAMDNDALRRGRPTVWKAFDEWTAILAGDALLTLAFELLARPSTHPDPERRVELVATLGRAAGAAGMVGGQALDLDADKRGEPPSPSADHVRRLQAMKTGALMVAACEMGAIVGGAGPAERKALVSYGRAIGLAFQIADDLLDAEGDAAVVGKAVAKDQEAGKATLVSVLGVEAARAELKRAEAEATAALAPFGAKAATLLAAARFVIQRES